MMCFFTPTHFGTLSTFGITERRRTELNQASDFGTLSTFGITEHNTINPVMALDFGTLSTFGITELKFPDEP